MARISQAWPPRDSVFNEQDAKIATLLCKLVLVMGPKNCPYYQHVKDHIPNVLEQPWSSDMSGTPKHVVFNNKTCKVTEVLDFETGNAGCLQRPTIDCGENIVLHLDDVRFREQPELETMDLDQLKFFQEILKRSIKSKFYFQLAGWVAKVKGKRRKKKQEQAVEGQDDSRPTNSAGERRKKEGKRSVKGQNDPRPTDNLGARRKKKREQAVEEQDDSRSRCKACLLGFCDNSFLPHVKTSKGRH